MKQLIFACFFGSLCLQMMGQDDMYFLSSKKENIKSQVSQIVNSPGADSVDFISFDAVRGEYPDSIYNESTDYQCTRNMERFDGYDWQDAYSQGYRDGSFDSYSWNYSWPYSYYYGFYDPWFDPYYYSSWYYPAWHYNSWSLYYRPYYHHWCYRPTYVRVPNSYTNRHVSVTRRHQVPQHYRSGTERTPSVTRNFGSEYRSNSSSSMRSRGSVGGSFRGNAGGGGGVHRGAR
ncbi:MAG: hypothetical protein ACI4BA_04120 [Prevotella sp.]